MQKYDAVIVGGGIIGLTLALELRKHSLEVLVLERGEPGREASWAGAGMLAAAEVDGPDCLCALAHLSAAMYPEFVQRAEAASGAKVDFNEGGAICLSSDPNRVHAPMTAEQLMQLEPALEATALYMGFSSEAFVEPRSLFAALLQQARHEGVHVHGGSEVTALNVTAGAVRAVRTRQTEFAAGVVVNCAGAWAGKVSPAPLPMRPVKGHMLALIPAKPHPIQHVIRQRDADVYLVPRADGRIAVGSTVEDAGFDKHVDPAVIQSLHQKAADIVPTLGEAKIHEAWAGLRPATADALPVMGATAIQHYFVSTGHYRNGILLAPASAFVMAELIVAGNSLIDLAPLSPARFVTGN